MLVRGITGDERLVAVLKFSDGILDTRMRLMFNPLRDSATRYINPMSQSTDLITLENINGGVKGVKGCLEKPICGSE